MTTADYLLIKAARYGGVNSIRNLLKAGAKINTTNSRGLTALTIAVKYCKQDVVKVLLEAGASVSGNIYNAPTILYAARYGNSEIIKLLLEAGADVNEEEDQSGYTALDVAKKYSKQANVKALLEAGAH